MFRLHHNFIMAVWRVGLGEGKREIIVGLSLSLGRPAIILGMIIHPTVLKPSVENCCKGGDEFTCRTDPCRCQGAGRMKDRIAETPRSEGLLCTVYSFGTVSRDAFVDCGPSQLH